jgi:hypothetical protein
MNTWIHNLRAVQISGPRIPTLKRKQKQLFTRCFKIPGGCSSQLMWGCLFPPAIAQEFKKALKTEWRPVGGKEQTGLLQTLWVMPLYQVHHIDVWETKTNTQEEICKHFTHTHSYTHTLTHTLTLSLLHTRSLTLSLTHTLSYTHTLLHSLSYTHTLTLSYTHTCTHARAHTHTYTYSWPGWPLGSFEFYKWMIS